MARVLHRALHVRVERDLDLDHARVVGRSRASLGAPLHHLRQDRFGIELARLAAGADQAVAHSAGIFRDQRAGRRDIDRNGRRGPIVDGRVLGAIILAFERHFLLGPELAHQRDGLAQTREPFFELGPFHAGRGNLVQRFPGADAKHDPIGKHDPQRREGLRQDGRDDSERWASCTLVPMVMRDVTAPSAPSHASEKGAWPP